MRTAIYYLKQNNINTIINELNPPVFKHLIDNIKQTQGDNSQIIVFSFYVGTLKYLRRYINEELPPINQQLKYISRIKVETIYNCLNLSDDLVLLVSKNYLNFFQLKILK